jgi:hypothetical protein
MSEKKLSPAVVKRLRARPYYSYLYALNVLGGRLPEDMEMCFVNEPQCAFLYARDVVRGRLPDPVHNGLVMYSMEKKDDGGWVSEYLKLAG